ncbi:hypothetical protein PoB_006406100 [Plakobranchus ocellatus]|uniref:Ig-like domain-containing protein n=1 Tax=Plakobranchus ocellatus TaxID=259542 RepID=A0AAV4D015_9GAST|nr:hypothetical protein PoB_006406100 [Plakobranchus ocellatus]
MEVQLPQGFAHAYIGQTILLRCSVLLQEGWFEITATVPSNNTYLWQNGTGLSYDADLLQAPRMVLPAKSYDLVFNDKDLLSISCAAFVGTNGQLIWVLLTSYGFQDWKMGPDAILLNNGSVNTRASFSESAVIIEEFFKNKNISWKITLDPDQGPFIASTFQMVVSYGLDGASLACRSHSLEDAALNTGHMTVISPTITDIYIVLAVLILGLLLLFAVTIFFIFVIPAAGMQMFKAKKSIKGRRSKIGPRKSIPGQAKRPGAAPTPLRGRSSKKSKTGTAALEGRPSGATGAVQGTGDKPTTWAPMFSNSWAWMKDKLGITKGRESKALSNKSISGPAESPDAAASPPGDLSSRKPETDRDLTVSESGPSGATETTGSTRVKDKLGITRSTFV